MFAEDMCVAPCDSCLGINEIGEIKAVSVDVGENVLSVFSEFRVVQIQYGDHGLGRSISVTGGGNVAGQKEAETTSA